MTMDSFISWMGGKKLLRKEICSLFPQQFDRYIEVFGGAGWVLFHADKHAKFEVYNDINSNLYNLFRCIKYHPNAIIEELDLVLNSREQFLAYQRQNVENLTDIQRAARYFYLIKASFGNKVSTFGAKAKNYNSIKGLEEIRERLKTVIIENKSFEGLIKQYDRENALFYCDPPYYKTEKYYDTGDFIFNEEQHINLRNILSKIKGKFILSYNDCEFIRNLYKDFKIKSTSRTNNLSTKKQQEYKELIITNYK